MDVVEAAQQRQGVGPLGRGGQTQQLDRRHMVEQRLVRPGGSVVELVDDDHIEVVGRQIVETGGGQALDRREHVLELRRALAAHPPLAERRLPQGVAERSLALLEDLLPVGDE